MKRIFVTAFVLFAIASVAGAEGLGGKFGIGANWLGGHMRYAVTDHWIVEGKAQLGFRNTLAGTRLYYVFTTVPGGICVCPYTGIEFGWPFSKYLTGGYETGAFLGVEFLVAEHLGLGTDMGLHYVDIWSELGGINDIGLIFNVNITYYF